MNLHAEMADAAAETARAVGGADPGQLDKPTPCGDWDLHALLNHVILWTAHSAERRARDEPLPEDLMTTDFAADPGFGAAYAAQLDRAVGAWSDPAAWEGELKVMGSPTPAADVGALLLAEMVLHGWDVARATGQDHRVSEGTAAAVYRAVEANAELFRKYQGFAAPVQVPGSAPVLDRALALSGRDPAWAPQA
jgi:uncharacterized protein (TIGR03086 family)